MCIFYTTILNYVMWLSHRKAGCKAAIRLERQCKRKRKIILVTEYDSERIKHFFEIGNEFLRLNFYHSLNYIFFDKCQISILDKFGLNSIQVL